MRTIEVQTAREMGERLIEFLRGLPSTLGRRALVLVPREAVAHELRRQVLSGQDGARLLAGVSLLTPAAFAAEVCALSGNPVRAGREQAWPSVLKALIEEDRLKPSLGYYNLEHLKAHPGYPKAIAGTLLELDRADLDPAKLERLARRLRPPLDRRLQDLSALRRALDATLASASALTTPGLIRKAARQLSQLPALKNAFGPVCAFRVDTHESGLHHLLAALDQPVEVRLKSALPERLNLDFECTLHGGVEDELQAMVTWVEREVVKHQEPLGRLAVLAAQHCLVAPAADRLERLLGRERVLLAGGRAASTTQAGSLALLAFNAVAQGLPREPLADFLSGISDRVSPSHAVWLVSRLGVLGGREGDTLSWRQRINQQEENVRSSLQPLLGLIDLRESVSANVPFELVYGGMRQLLFLLPDTEERRQLERGLDQKAEVLQPAKSLLSGPRGLWALTEGIASIRVRQGRFGEARLFLGTPEQALGLCFTAARMVGLSEGSIPANPREDAVLPDEDRSLVREALDPEPAAGLPLRRELAALRLQAAVACIASLSQRLSASAALQQLHGVQHEPSTFLFDLAARTGSGFKEGASLPSTAELAETFSRPAQEALQRFERSRPHSFLRQAARVELKDQAAWIPSRWLEKSPSELPRITEQLRAQSSGQWGSACGAISQDLRISLPGLSAEAGISAGKLRLLLSCPLRFAREALLQMEEPAQFPSPYQLNALALGSALHQVVERFFSGHGASFLKQKQERSFKEQARRICREVFEVTLMGYALDGEKVRQLEFQRLWDLTEAALEFYQDGKLDSFKAAERKLPHPPVGWKLPSGTLHLKGRVDLILGGPEGLAVHDLKSSAPKPFRGDPPELNLNLDLQPLTYDACLRALGEDPAAEVGLVYASGGPGSRSRLLRGENLERGRAWAAEMLQLAHRLLKAGAFPATPDQDDCGYCPYAEICGGETSRAMESGLKRMEAADACPAGGGAAALAFWRARTGAGDKP